MLKRSALLAVTALFAAASPVQAANILISNDDGFETANIRALYEKLVAAGHSVIISAPTQNQSGQGGRVEFLRPIGPLAANTRWGSVAAGSAGVGTAPGNPDIHYVDGSPVMALLYGLDVAAPAKWGKQPDLVISGPNEGNNTGLVVNSSGTVANALYGINRGVPSIAISAGETTGRSFASLVPGTDVAYKGAEVVLQILETLKRKGKLPVPLLPAGTGLNVNIPAVTGACNASGYRLTQIGTATAFQPVFFADISTSALAAASGLGNVHLPGVSLLFPGAPPPAGVVVPADPSPNSEANVLAQCKVSVSVLRGVPDFRPNYTAALEYRLKQLPQ